MSDAARLKRVRRVARLLDNAVTLPGSKRLGIGLDGLLGLIPGAGDALGALLSSYIIIEALRLRVPPAILARMILNVALDTVLGVIPLLGDLFDFAWQANQRNVNLLERYLDSPEPARRHSIVVVSVVLLALLGIIALSVFVAISLIGMLLSAAGSL